MMLEVDPGRADLLLRHGRIVTMDPERRVLVDGAIAVRGGEIVAAGPDREVAPRFTAPAVRELNGALVHPGFVDAHVHMGSELIRGFAPKRSGEWGAAKNVLFSAHTPASDYLGALLPCMEMVANGSTLYADTGGSFYLDETIRAIETVGMRGIPGHWVADDATLPRANRHFLCAPEVEPLVASTEECLARLRAQLVRYPFGGGGRVRCAASTSGMGLSSDRLLIEAKQLADEHGTPMIMHIAWDEREVSASLTTHGRRPVEHLADLGILGPNLTLVHVIHVTEEEIGLIASSGTRVVHCPNVSLRRAQGAMRVGRFPEMLRAGIPVALGSDGLTGKHDIARQAYLAAMVSREVRGELPVITGETALEMATLHGAAALGMLDEVGSIEVGKRADIVIHRLDRPESHPLFQDPVDNLIFYAQSGTVGTVLVDGEAIFDGGRFTRFDAEAAYRQIDEAAAALETRIGPRTFAIWPLVE